MTGVLSCDQLSVEIDGKSLLHDVSIDIQRGEIVALVGPNGAGKSTLLSAMAGDLSPARGSITLHGRELSSYRPRELALLRAVLPQQSIIQFSFTAREIINMGRSPHGDMNSDGLAIEAAIARTDTRHLADRTFPTLSVGEQARVSLARVLAQETPLLLLDEPTAALDLRHQQLVMDVARELADDGATIAVIVHDLNYASAIADRIVILADGAIAATGTPWEVMTEPILERVFECRIEVTTHPAVDTPMVVPLMASTRRKAQTALLPSG